MNERNVIKASIELSFNLVSEIQSLAEAGSPFVSVLASDLLREAQAMHQRLCLINNALENSLSHERNLSAKRKITDDYEMK